ncbi:MAG: alpha-glucan family phosphorylase [Deltaproteobacteria bacterium]|nr:alpha-glucan family phosphorylase [Deltaproteobacteria bacterium]
MKTTMTRDPVCGMPVDAANAPHMEYEGRKISFCSELCRESFLKAPAAVPTGEVGPEERRIAYFTMEIALEPELPTYAGGLGVLAGDTIKSCADLRVPAVAVTLLQRRGYFTQTLDRQRGQRETPAVWNPQDVLRPLRPTVQIAIEGRQVQVCAWERDVGSEASFHVPVLFLDTDLPENPDFYRSLCGALYSGDDHYRLCQELVLGVGGVRMLAALGYSGLRRYHLNEGHAALATLELLRRRNGPRGTEWSFADVRRECVFTTHTPVPAGHDQFSRELVSRVLGDFVPRQVLEMLGGNTRLNMTSLALNLSGYVNAVAQKHGEVSREMFPGYGIHHVTNGVHSRTWTAPALARLFDEYLPGWSADPFLLRNAGRVPAQKIWEAHEFAKADLLTAVRDQTGRSLRADTLTIGFARRATQYKRADLIFSDLQRLRDAAARGGRFQLVFAGKAHPHDEPGKALIRRVLEVADGLGDEIPVVYLADYDMALAKKMVAGVDLWLNTPQRPLEASGTSGMKAAHNGVPSFSVLDGWWIEGHIEGVTGWAIGPAAVPVNASETSLHDSDDLYIKLGLIIAPMFYQRRDQWSVIMRNTIALNASFFNTHRMVQQYVTNAYL